MNKLKHLAAAIAMLATLGTAHAQKEQVVQDGIAVKPLSRVRVIVPEEQLNEAAAQQYQAMMSEAQQKGALVPATDPQVKRLRSVAQRIIPHTPRWNASAKGWQWQVNLFDQPQVNAFCMPGGRIGFYTGIINQLKLTDDEMAAIMGHEIAHALREHGRERAAKSGITSVVARGAGAIGAAIFGIDPSITNTVTGMIGQGVVLKFSRDEEREADLVGLDIAARAGYDPRAGIALWRKMAMLNKGAPPEFLSTHPGGETRIRDMEAHMNVLLPLYARSKGTTVKQLPPYRTNVALR
ncbi:MULTISPECIES: M48 family metallopeptidase [unclassified Massilia]|uniref:M48 family metallopeptidase n=1 Tax=unclassified Massilia TaxID=2609279 RepID=UPI0017816761|nr:MULTISPECIES: M48 family metallopeptidase [unclassified Massilia]MBD8530593.1 M48 family metallopeptidase [Massilia sp. CFBP 13647]MBD8674817.1 M48 family metallopeptidase [Massilia sp. CFBP 13721]